ncbi:MAG TPA: hypothetical protein VFB73_11930 [Chloroflexota bacterium]|nr:hypothetical protein [Chloroflexota bacterium]
MENELSYEFVRASPADVDQLRREVRYTLTHPDGRGRREGYRAAAERGELLLLVHEDPREHVRRLDGFVEFHMRVDDVLVIRDAGSVGEAPHPAIIKHLIGELLRSLAPVAAIVKVRRDATVWNEIFASIPGFDLAGSEYRRPHWINVWEWTRERAARARGRPRGGERRRR